MDARALADFAHELADRARAIARRRFRSAVAVEAKADGTPVTPVDREIEEVLRERIRRRFPDHGVLGEELGSEALDAEHVWVLDPIDGTKAFVSGKPLFGTLIGLVRAGAPVLGVIEAPATRERWFGQDGVGAFLDGEPVRVRAGRGLRGAVLCLGRPCGGEPRPGPRRVLDAVGWANHQLDCYAYGLLAMGQVDLVCEYGIDASDVCALVPVVRNAGGVVTRWSGAPVGLDGDDTLVAASCEALAREARELLAG